MLRYNTETNIFEAYDGLWVTLGGVYDADRDTYVTAELTLAQMMTTDLPRISSRCSKERFDAPRLKLMTLHI